MSIIIEDALAKIFSIILWAILWIILFPLFIILLTPYILISSIYGSEPYKVELIKKYKKYLKIWLESGLINLFP
jgi:hypothetical protein